MAVQRLDDGEMPEVIGRDADSATVTLYQPQATKVRQAKVDAVINYAQTVRDWPLLEQAVEQKIEDQREFVRWWEETVTTRHGMGRPPAREEKNPDRRSFPVGVAEDATGISQQQVSKWRKRLQEPEKYRDVLFGAAYRVAMGEAADVLATKHTGDEESYTPARLIEAARATMGAIDLDPASNAMAQECVRAERWFGVEENGLSRAWHGRVWLNPPYTRGLIDLFVTKLCDAHSTGMVPQAVLLTNNNTDTGWWHEAALKASGVCFTLGRINFHKRDGSLSSPTNGQTLFYFGDDQGGFVEHFSSVGMIMDRVHDP